MKFFSRLLLAFAMLLSLAVAAHAVSFSKADKNKDGYVTFREAERVLPGLSEVHYKKFINGPDETITKLGWAALDNFYRMMYRNRR